MSVVRTIYHRRILDKREGKKRELMKECRSKVLLFYTQQTDKTNTKHVLFKIKLMHLARFLLGTMIGVPIRVSPKP